MSYSIPEGSKFFYSTSFASATTVASATNANPSVVTTVGHGYVDNDELLVTNGSWEDALDTIWRANQLTADTYQILGLDSSDTNFFAAGGLAGASVQKVSSWVEIPQVLTIATQGGDPRYTQVNPLSRRNGFQIPTGFNPSSVTLTLGHDPSNATQQAMVGISRRLSKVAFKMTLSGGAAAYGYGFMAVSEVPVLNVNQVNTITAAFAMQGRTISYGT